MGHPLREFRDSAEESLKQELFSEKPIYDDFDTLKLADGLTLLAEELGPDSDLVRDCRRRLQVLT